MLDQERLIAYLADTIDGAERARVEAELAGDREAQRHLADQQLMDQALRVALGGSAADQRVIESVLAVVRAASAEQLRSDVLRDTVAALLRQKGRGRRAWVRVLTAAVSPVDVLRAWMVARSARVRFASAVAIFTIVITTGTWLHFRQSGQIGKFAAVVRAPKVQHAGKRSTLLLGHIWSKVQKTTNAPQFAVHTPVATAVVRGTEFGLKVRKTENPPLSWRLVVPRKLSRICAKQSSWTQVMGSRTRTLDSFI